MGGDVAGCLPGGEHRQDLALALGEFRQRGALGWRCGEVGQDPVGDLGSEHRFAAATARIAATSSAWWVPLST